jgi:MoaA/NifB/PqqE/SkfB family radical SAM enzyme
MEMKVEGTTLYRSTFDENTGVIARVTYEGKDHYDRIPHQIRDAYEKLYPRRFYGGIFSPVPETVDVSITDKCHFGCSYCYQDSTPDKEHGPKELVETIIKGFKQPPYQMAIGGGEPTLHPDLPYILKTCRELGTVPNFTTAGDKMSQRVIDATNEYCGGVAMTFHSFKGIDWFVEHYSRLKSSLRCQLNVHVIADKDVAKSLHALADKFKQLGPLNIVLLAYYPDVGRASLESLVTKRVYMKDLPNAIYAARASRSKIAFSEGLLPYFLSRPEIGVDTTFAMAMEGNYSCYFDPEGRISTSSFSPPHRDEKNVFKVKSQMLWDGIWGGHSEPRGELCYDCEFRKRCSTPSEFHYLLCAFASHNAIPLVEPKVTPKTVYDHLLEDDED